MGPTIVHNAQHPVTAQNDPYKLLSLWARVLATFVAVVINARLREETHHCKARSPVRCDTCQTSGVTATLSSASRASQTRCLPECWGYSVCIRVCQREEVSLCQAINMMLSETVRIPIQKNHRNWKVHLSLCFTFPLWVYTLLPTVLL